MQADKAKSKKNMSEKKIRKPKIDLIVFDLIHFGMFHRKILGDTEIPVNFSAALDRRFQILHGALQRCNGRPPAPLLCWRPLPSTARGKVETVPALAINTVFFDRCQP